jgi:hypothetical protein
MHESNAVAARLSEGKRPVGDRSMTVEYRYRDPRYRAKRDADSSYWGAAAAAMLPTIAAPPSPECLP